MEYQQQRSNAFSNHFSFQKVGITPVSGDTPSRLNTSLASFRGRAHRRLRQILPPLPQFSFRDESRPKWGSEVRGLGGAKDFVVVILAQYPRWIMTFRGEEHNLQLNAVRKDPQVLLKCLGYQHGDTSRRWYFVMDFDVDYEDAEGLIERLPRAKLPGTEAFVLPTREGILGILQEAYRGGGSGFVHCGMHAMYTYTGASSITREEDGTIRYIEIPDGSPTKQAFIVGTDGVRLYGRDFIRRLSDGDDKRCGTTLTLMFDMCNAAEFLAGIVELPYRYCSPTFNGGASSSSASRSTNQLVVISASQRGQTAGEFSGCGALTYLLATALMNESDGQQASTASDIIRRIHNVCKTQPNPAFLQTPQIASRYPLTESFWLIPKLRSVL